MRSNMQFRKSSAGWVQASLRLACSAIVLCGMGFASPIFAQAPAAPLDGKPTPAAAAPAGGGLGKGERLPRKLSDLLDADGDGKVSDAEAQAAVKEVQKKGTAKNADGDALRKSLDANGDGKVDVKEAQAGVAKGRGEMDERARKVLDMLVWLDADKSGEVSVPEFKALIEKMGFLGKLAEPKLGEMFNNMDQDRNGSITMAEGQLAADYFAAVAMQEEQKKEAVRTAAAAQLVASLDRNRDKKISIREAAKTPVAERFAIVDADQDGQLTIAEVARFIDAPAPAPAAPAVQNRVNGLPRNLRR